MKSIVIIPPSGDIRKVEVGEGEIPYEILSKGVEGYIELIPTTIDGVCAFINEEGKLNNLPFNERATNLYKFGNYDSIVGNMVLFKADGPNSLGLTEEEVAEVMKKVA